MDRLLESLNIFICVYFAVYIVGEIVSLKLNTQSKINIASISYTLN